MTDIITYFGLIGFVMIICSFLTGMRIIKVKPKYHIHKKIGIIGFCIITVHALFMSYYYFFT